MRRAARVLGALCLVASATLALGTPSAGAEAPEGAGWWYKLRQGPLPTPAPPAAPADGLYLAEDPTGPVAMAALRFDVAGKDIGEPVLTLKAAAGSTFNGTAIAACRITSPWTPALAASWDAKPTVTCQAGDAPGVVSADGASMSWTLSSAFTTADGRTLEVALVPQGSVPFQVGVQKPGGDAFAMPAAPEPAPASGQPAAEPSGAPVAEAVPSEAAGTTGGSSSPSFDPGRFAVDTPAPTPAPAFTPSPAALPPEEAALQAPSTASSVPVRALPRPNPAGDDGRGERIMAVVLLAAIGAALMWLGGRPARVPRLIGGLGARSAPTPAPAAAADTSVRVGGIGRFARPRTAAPSRL